MDRFVLRFAAGAAAILICAAFTTIGGTAASAAPRIPTGGSSAAQTAARVALASMRLGAPGLDKRPRGAARAGAASSVNWSGYANDHGKGTVYKMVSGTWTQPAVTCTKEDTIVAFWVGLDGFSSSSVEQDGTYAQCFEGVAHYFSWWEMYPTNSVQIVHAIHPGDTITGLVSFASGHYTLGITDATTPSASFTRTKACGAGVKCANTSAEWIAERPGLNTGLGPLAKFGSWTLTGAKVTGGVKTGTILNFPHDAIDMTDSTQTYNLATPGRLNAAGNKFSVTWNNSF